MAFDGFLKIDGIKGESQDAKHKGEIDVLSFTMNVSQKGSQANGGGGGTGKVEYEDIQFIKKVDASSVLLLVNCSCGAHLREATFVVRKAGGTQLEYLKIKLTDVLISGYKPYGRAQQNEYVNFKQDWSGWQNFKEVQGTPPGMAAGATQTFGDEIPLEAVSLNFSRIEIAYQPQDSSGNAQGGPIMGGWDLKQGKKI